jgi:hypothetical protein
MPKRRTSDKQYHDISQTIDIIKLRDSIKVDFQNFNDPRLAERSLYPSWYLFLVIISGYLSDCNTLEDIAHFAYLRREWLSSLNDKNLGAPSYDTLWWFLARTEPKAFKELLSRWLSKIPLDFRDKLLMIDGKRLRGVSDNEHISHIVELFAAERCIVIAQEKVPEKRDERQALPQLLEAINIDAFFLQRASISAPMIDIPIQRVLQKLPSHTKIILRLAFPMSSRNALILFASFINVVDKLCVILA